MSTLTKDPEAPPRSWLRTAAAGVGRALAFPVVALAIALLLGAVLVLASGGDPLAAYAALVRGAVGSRVALGRTLLNATPLVFTGLAVAVAFRAGLFNIGGEGQLVLGSIAATAVALLVPGPGPVVIVLALLAAGVAGFAWGALPGLLKIRGAHEVITTIMLNFVATNLVVYLAQNPLSGEGSLPGTAAVDATRRLALLGGGIARAHWGVALALVAAVVAYVLLWRTTRGYAIRAVGLGPGAARHAGIPVASNAVFAIALAGLFAGIGGGVEVLGTYGRVSVPFVSGLGFAGIGVAVLGRNHPLGCLVGALFFGGLAAGAQEMQFAADVPLDLADVLLAIVLLFVTATRLVEVVLGRRARVLPGATRLERGLGA